MQIASGRVIGGRVELDSALPEGATVTVIAREADETFEAVASILTCGLSPSRAILQ